MSLNSHKPEKKKKRHKDPQALAAMIRKFEMEKDAMKKEPTQDPPLLTVVNTASKTALAARNELSDLSLGCDPVLSIFGSTSERELLQEAENALEMLSNLDFDQLLNAASNDSPLSDTGEENCVVGHNVSHDLSPKQIPDLPEGLPAKLEKRIEDLRVAAKLFDEEGRKKFFTQDMNNILLD